VGRVQVGRLTSTRRAGRRRAASTGRRGWLPPGAVPWALYAIAVLLVPVGILAVYSLWRAEFFDVAREWTGENYAEILSGDLYPMLLLKSLGVGLLSAAIMVVCGFAMAHAITFRMRRAGTWVLLLVIMTLLASYLVRIYAWGTILGTQGIVNRALVGIGLLEEPLSFLFYGYFAIVVTLVYVYLPVAVLVIYGGLQSIDRRTLEASRDMGAGRWRTLRDVTAPQALPGIRAAFALCFVLASADYVTPTLVGGASGQMVGSVIRDQFGNAANIPRGAALAIVSVAALVVVLAALLALERGIRRLARALPSPRLGRGGPRRASSWRDAVARTSFSLPAAIGLLAFLLAPLAVVVVFSFNEARIPSLPLTGLTTRWYGEVVGREELGRVLGTSLGVMAVAVVGGLALGVPAAIALARRSFRLRALIGASVFAPVAIPGVVVGVALLTALTYLEVRLGRWPTAIAHVLLVVPFVVLVVRSRLEELDPRIGEAGRDLGATPGRVLRTITLPIVAPSLVGAGVLAAAVSLDEVLVTSFTIGADATLPVWILSQMRRGLTPGVNALAVLILVASLALLALAAAILRLRAPGAARIVGRRR
jgi:ABC-type spermidine/putrescine transport system permease subunit II